MMTIVYSNHDCCVITIIMSFGACEWLVLGELLLGAEESMRRQKDTGSRWCMLINFRGGRRIRGRRNWIFHIYTKPCELKDEVVLKPPKTCSCIGLGGVHGTTIIAQCPNETLRNKRIIMRGCPCTLASLLSSSQKLSTQIAHFVLFQLNV